MANSTRRTFGIPVLVAVFAGGVAIGALSQRPAAAQMGGIGGKAMEAAGGQEGTVGAVGKLGTSIVDMQEHVEALQKNLDTLKTVQKALGG